MKGCQHIAKTMHARHIVVRDYLKYWATHRIGADPRGPTTLLIQAASNDTSVGTTLSELRKLLPPGEKIVKTYGGTVNGRKRWHYRWETA